MSDSVKVALVTGSTSGIGLACAHALAKRGVNIIVTGSRDATLVTDILADIKGHGMRADYVSADLSKVADIEALWSEVTRLYPDGIDILVNNAGIQIFGNTVDNVIDEHWDKILAVNLSAPFHLIKRCLPKMKKKGWGRIVNMSSIAGLAGYPGISPYTAAKHGLIGLTKGVALENAAHGITCNAVCPGFVTTPLLTEVFQQLAAGGGQSVQEVENAFMKIGCQSGKYITTDQVAELVEFLCLSNASSQMTGAAYLIDDGYTAQ